MIEFFGEFFIFLFERVYLSGLFLMLVVVLFEKIELDEFVGILLFEYLIGLFLILDDLMERDDLLIEIMINILKMLSLDLFRMRKWDLVESELVDF